jgi:aspartate/glutamate racemase/prolyl-tRNA editing enzyme YbaK/EbsC (Cys-tRNA(Pro) deacylase)
MSTSSQIKKASDLLRRGEHVVPDAVRRAETFLADAGIWYRLARNSPAMGCRDAAQRRERLGHRGIPLWDELKSLAFLDDRGLAIAHCRGDEDFDVEALSAAFGVSDLTAADEVTLEGLGLGYGLINPFGTWTDQTLAVRHVFDRGLLERIGTPGTMMTNAGERTWAVEFFAPDLIKALANTQVARITTKISDGSRPPWTHDRRAVGIVTGNAPESGVALLRTTVDSVRLGLGRFNLGDISMPRIHLASIPEMGLSMELSERAEAVSCALVETVDKLCVEGCSVIAVACNTTQYFRAELERTCERYGATFLSMPEVVAEWLRAHAVSSVGLVGIRYVSDLGEWSAYREVLADFEVETPSDRDMQRIEEIAYQVKEKGPTAHGVQRLQNVLRDALSTDVIIVALTELSLLLELPTRVRKELTLIDPLHLYGQALAAHVLGMSHDDLLLGTEDSPHFRMSRP